MNAVTELGAILASAGFDPARVQVTPWHGLRIAHDPDDLPEPGREHVPGANTSGDLLARATVRLPVGHALDLGTGSGIHALLAAGHADRVTAVDINPRALRFTALNARLNGLANVQTREGSWLEPVAGASFDLVVCNPPYVLSPDRDYLFRDGGEGLAERLVREIPAHLIEGGFGHVLCNWGTRAGAAPWPVPEAWTRGSGCDALAVAFASEGARTYAARWAGDAAQAGRWLDHYAAAGIETIWLGLVLLRRRDGANWFRGVGAPGPVEGSASAHLLRLVAAQDRLATGAPLADERLRLAPGATVAQEGGRAALSLTEGLGVVAALDPGLVPALEQLDGTRPLGAALPVATALQLFELGLLERVP